ncbi:MAG TPA: C45 family autoproteolytic acyltransferase/hydrolase [Spirochaetota bacterium]|nr:C45 family autoproteolytic acyltransferase/hydrolase [Spirochaetota bacterium]HQE58667.1 C45 family autoproteolytic acyltransferase/hydrolase [Spirochaetota bacterium]
METSVKTKKFKHVILEGNHYEIGKKQGKELLTVPEFVKWYTSPPSGKGKLSDKDYAEAVNFFDKYCPGINTEIEGMSEVLKVHPREIVYYAFTHTPKGNCSHFALLPEITENGHTMVGRSYEWNDTQDDFRLCTTKVKGKAAHLGFSCIMLGRIDGINEHGLSVTMSAGAPMREISAEGIKFWALIRTILENCKTTEEAIETVMTTPVSFYLNLIIADKTGRAALAEIACGKKEIHHINIESKKQYIHSTNHFTLNGMVQETTRRMKHSIKRYDAIDKRINKSIPKVSYSDIKEILSDKMPDGVACHHYSETLGTLWSLIFDLDECRADICFGSPQVNEWHSFNLSSEQNETHYEAKLPDELADPSIWGNI